MVIFEYSDYFYPEMIGSFRKKSMVILKMIMVVWKSDCDALEKTIRWISKTPVFGWKKGWKVAVFHLFSLFFWSFFNNQSDGKKQDMLTHPHFTAFKASCMIYLLFQSPDCLQSDKPQPPNSAVFSHQAFTWLQINDSTRG